MLDQYSNVLITGATGLIGGEVARALAVGPVRQVWALVRPAAALDARTRLSVRLGPVGVAPLLQAVPGDVCLPDLGLPPHEAAIISPAVDFIIHCAAETSFIRQEACRQVNVLGMQHLIAFARRCVKRPLIVFLSTAANCGVKPDCCVPEEDGCDLRVRHCNEYTRSKAQAELLLRDSGLPALVLRPSIVLSAGVTGKRFAMNILWCLPLIHFLGTAPVDPAARLDFVSVQFVVECLLKLLRRPARRYGCYHLSAGLGGAVRCVAIARFLDRFYKRSEPIRLALPEDSTTQEARRLARNRSQRMVLARLRHYLPFINMDAVFDNQRLREELGPDLPHNPDLFFYLGSLLEQFSVRDALNASLNP